MKKITSESNRINIKLKNSKDNIKYITIVDTDEIQFYKSINNSKEYNEAYLKYQNYHSGRFEPHINKNFYDFCIEKKYNITKIYEKIETLSIIINGNVYDFSYIPEYTIKYADIIITHLLPIDKQLEMLETIFDNFLKINSY